jgi:hypothetical protein
MYFVNIDVFGHTVFLNQSYLNILLKFRSGCHLEKIYRLDVEGSRILTQKITKTLLSECTGFAVKCKM